MQTAQPPWHVIQTHEEVVFAAVGVTNGVREESEASAAAIVVYECWPGKCAPSICDDLRG